MKNLNYLFTLFLGISMLFSCKNETEVQPTEQVKFTLDGKETVIDKSAVKSVLYSDASDPVKALDVILPIDASGSLKFFIADLKTGTITLTPKTGAKVKSLGFNAKRADNTTQPYVQHTNGTTNVFANSGTMNLTYNETTGDYDYTWDVTLKDAAGREYKSAGKMAANTKTAQAKAKNEIADPTPTTGAQSTMVIFEDTAAIYKFNLDGSGKVKLSSETAASSNSYIAGVTINPVSKRIFYIFTPKYDQAKTFYSLNADGSGKKTVKTFSGTAVVPQMYSFGGKLLMKSTTLVNQNMVTIVSMMDEDGANENEFIKGSFHFDLAAASGTKMVYTGSYSDKATQDCYVMPVTNFSWKEGDSFHARGIPGKTINKFAISADGQTMVALSQIPMTNNWDVYIVDISNKDGATTKIGTWTAPTLPTQPTSSPAFPSDILFANGSDQLIITYDYHKDYNQGGAYPEDYIMLEFYNAGDFNKIKSWKIMGEHTGRVYVD